MKRFIINIVFVLSLFQVIGLVYFLLFGQIRVFDETVITNPILMPLFFMGPMLGMFISFSGFPGVLSSFAASWIAFLSPVVPFLFFLKLFFKINTKKQILKIVTPILIISFSFFLLTMLYDFLGEVRFQIRKKDRADILNTQIQLFNQGLKVEYVGIMNFDDRGFTDSGESSYVHRFSVNADPSVLNQLEKGTYLLCLRRVEVNDTDRKKNTCLIRSKLHINNDDPRVLFDPILETDYSFTYSLIEPALEVGDDRLSIALTGNKSDNSQQVAELSISRTEKIIDDAGYIFGGEITKIPIVGPFTNTFLSSQ